ncbi:hypothetical protein [Clostridium sp. 1xD42-85]|uniref:hypothetical protein n=1 Tax=Clostridium sp. 1xD42-85 TaxID=2320084 RepID=UPI000EA22F85|nr:hypothetical protein [Clostridium sp. 1xD42-85]NBJ68245.1 hypothetical protein [Roseburia sp. 1XD42-34]RKI82011.1 hypothetical protein D7V87_01975 [Clostridium sp. 1xD42-85]
MFSKKVYQFIEGMTGSGIDENEVGYFALHIVRRWNEKTSIEPRRMNIHCLNIHFILAGCNHPF